MANHHYFTNHKNCNRSLFGVSDCTSLFIVETAKKKNLGALQKSVLKTFVKENKMHRLIFHTFNWKAKDPENLRSKILPNNCHKKTNQRVASKYWRPWKPKELTNLVVLKLSQDYGLRCATWNEYFGTLNNLELLSQETFVNTKKHI